MNDLAPKLHELFEKLGLVYEPLGAGTDSTGGDITFGRAREHVEGINSTIFVKATGLLATLSVIPGIFPGNKMLPDRFELAIRLLSLNSRFAFGRVALINSTDKVLVLVCETMFYLHELITPETETEIRQRIEALRRLEGAVSELLGDS
jgi:hypothetical protein